MESAVVDAIDHLHSSKETWNKPYTWVFLLAVPIYPLCLFNFISTLRYSSIITLVSSVFIAILTVVELANNNPFDLPLVPTTWTNVLLSVPLVLFAYTCQPNVGDIYKVRNM